MILKSVIALTTSFSTIVGALYLCCHAKWLSVKMLLSQTIVPKINKSQSSLQPLDGLDSTLRCPTLSIIIPLYNRVAFIETAIRSVIEQEYNIELIVIDGGSTDGSWQLIQSHKDGIAYSISEPDKGIYDAMNKGIDQAEGE